MIDDYDEIGARIVPSHVESSYAGGNDEWPDEVARGHSTVRATMNQSIEGVSPGCARDARLRTDVAAELSFFNDPEAAHAFIATGITPFLATLPQRLRVLDLGGGDGYLLEQIAASLRGCGREVHGTVIDVNIESLMEAQRRGLDVLPVALEHMRLQPAHILSMRLVNHYGGWARQAAVFARIHAGLHPGGYFVLQAETGTRRHCAYRNVVAKMLESADGGLRTREVCRWVPVATLERALLREGLEIRSIEPCFMSFATRLSTLLQLAWDRRYGLPLTTTHLVARDRMVTAALELARRHLPEGPASGLECDAAGEWLLRTRHSLIVARRPAH